MLVTDDVKKCVAFLFCQTEDGLKRVGTAFFVSVKSQVEKDKTFVYLVTAKHVIVKIQQKSVDQQVHVRMNRMDAPAEFVQIHIKSWLYHPEDGLIDVASTAWAPPRERFDYLCVSLDSFATKDVVEKEKIGIGDEVFLVGLFVNHIGQQKNIPIMRIGNIAAMPEPGEPITTRDLGNIEAYIIESRSIGGLSGSPVFVHIGGVRLGKIGGGKFYLLGLMHGHWDLPISDADGFTTDLYNDERVNMGLAIVIPVYSILEVINQPVFKAVREVIDAQLSIKSSQQPDAVTDENRNTHN